MVTLGSVSKRGARATRGRLKLGIHGRTSAEFQRELEAIEGKVIELPPWSCGIRPRDPSSGWVAITRRLNTANATRSSRALRSRQLVNREILPQAPSPDLRFWVPVANRARLNARPRRGDRPRASYILSDDLSPRSRGLVERMGELASNMWRQAADAWYKRDRSAAFALEMRDDEMDELHASLTAELAAGRMTLPVTMEMTLVARLYERLGDHAVNVARRVIYLAGSASDGPPTN